MNGTAPTQEETPLEEIFNSVPTNRKGLTFDSFIIASINHHYHYIVSRNTKKIMKK